MGSVGDALNDAQIGAPIGAVCESFLATLECELVDRCRFQSRAEARTAVFYLIEGRSQSRPPTLRPRPPLPTEFKAQAHAMNERT